MESSEATQRQAKVLAEISSRLTHFSRLATWLRILHLVLGFLAVVSSVVVASTISSLPPQWIKVLALVAALSIGIQTGFDVGAKANRARQAWRALYVAKMRFDTSPNFTIGDLVTAYEKGEETIGDVKEDVK